MIKFGLLSCSFSLTGRADYKNPLANETELMFFFKPSEIKIEQCAMYNGQMPSDSDIAAHPDYA
jgi:hypothetical protein